MFNESEHFVSCKYFKGHPLALDQLLNKNIAIQIYFKL